MNKSQSGQIGLVVLLIAAVLLTMGIGIASQSVLETKTATEESNTSKVFNLTERAIEKALSDLSEPSGTYSGVPYTVTSDPTSYTTDVLQGDSAQLDISKTSNLKISWPFVGSCDTASIVVTLIGGFNGESLTRYAFNPGVCNSRSNGFPSASCENGGNCEVTLNSLPFLKKIARVKVLYANTTLTASLTGDAVQSYVVQAEGTDAETGETRAIKAVRSMPAVPAIFDYALFSGNGSISQ